MGKLNNIKHEIFCNNVIKEKGNLVKAYSNTYPDSKYNTARSSASTLVQTIPTIKPRIHELLEQDKGTSPTAVKQALVRSLVATKPIVTKQGIAGYVPDNQVQASTAQFLAKGYGFGNDTIQPQANVSIHIDLDRLGSIVDKLTVISNKIKDIPIERSGEIIDL